MQWISTPLDTGLTPVEGATLEVNMIPNNNMLAEKITIFTLCVMLFMAWVFSIVAANNNPTIRSSEQAYVLITSKTEENTPKEIYIGTYHDHYQCSHAVQRYINQHPYPNIIQGWICAIDCFPVGNKLPASCKIIEKNR